MGLYNFSDQIVFKILRDIEHGYLEITKYNGELLKFGNPNSPLKSVLKIKKPNFTFNLIIGGSVGFAESYMRDEFETDNLSNLIEITARNIKIIYKFSGLLDFPMVNYVKNIFIKNTRGRSKDNISKHYDLGNEFFALWLDKTLTYSSAIFDEKKLLWLNGLYIRSTKEEVFEKTAIYQIENDLSRTLFTDELNRLTKILPSVQERIETLNDLTPQVLFLLDEPFVVNSEEWDSVNSAEAQSYLENIREKFKDLEEFSLENIELVMREALKDLDIKTKIGFQATRVSVTGTKISPPLFESCLLYTSPSPRDGLLTRMPSCA